MQLFTANLLVLSFLLILPRHVPSRAPAHVSESIDLGLASHIITQRLKGLCLDNFRSSTQWWSYQWCSEGQVPKSPIRSFPFIILIYVSINFEFLLFYRVPPGTASSSGGRSDERETHSVHVCRCELHVV